MNITYCLFHLLIDHRSQLLVPDSRPIVLPNTIPILAQYFKMPISALYECGHGEVLGPNSANFLLFRRRAPVSGPPIWSVFHYTHVSIHLTVHKLFKIHHKKRFFTLPVSDIAFSPEFPHTLPCILPLPLR